MMRTMYLKKSLVYSMFESDVGVSARIWEQIK